MRRYWNIVILTGAGISAESGISTFRDPDGLWAKYDVEEVATPQAFAKNPTLVHEFYSLRRRGLATVTPNAAHRALAQLEAGLAGRSHVTVVTQNVDDLHERAGTKSLIHMHGELLKAWCQLCDARTAWRGDMSTASECAHCKRAGRVRPDIVWFGEMPYRMDEIHELIEGCDLFMSIGTSGNVYPAAGFVAGARAAGAHTVELNLEPSEGASLFAEAIHGKASVIVPAYVERLLTAAG
jgi:NAD-dependent deacetylase